MAFENIANDYGLIGKVAIVSGAGGPIGQGFDEGVTNGRAAAILLARAGAKVCVVGRTLELAQHTVDIIKKEGGEAFAHVADVTKEADCRGAVEATDGALRPPRLPRQQRRPQRAGRCHRDAASRSGAACSRSMSTA